MILAATTVVSLQCKEVHERLFYDFQKNECRVDQEALCFQIHYRMRAIITHGLYIFHPIFQCGL